MSAAGLGLGLPTRTLINMPRVGTELCPDPLFADALAWVFGAGVTHNNPGITIASNVSVPIADTAQPVGLVQGRKYQVTVVVDAVTAPGAGFVATIGGTATSAITTVGTHVFEVVAGAVADTSLDRTGTNDFAGTVSAFRIKPILWG